MWQQLCLTLICVATLSGCNRPDYDPPTLIKSLRVLAVRADPPYIANGATQLSTFVVGQKPGQTLCYAWALCGFAWMEDGNFRCVDPSLQVDLGNQPRAQVSLLDALPILLNAEAVLKEKGFKPPASVDSNTSGNTDKSPGIELANSFEMTLLYQVSEARVWGGNCPRDTALMLAKPCPTRDGCMFGQKGLAVVIPSDDGKPSRARHANPKLEMLALDGVPWPAGVTPTVAVYTAPPETDLTQLNKTQGLEILPVWAPGSRELVRKSAEAGVPDRLERLIFDFFSDAGTFQFTATSDQRADNGFKTKKPANGDKSQLVTLWVVVRDGRGGTDWSTRQLRVDVDAPTDRHALCDPDPSLPKCDEVKP